VRVKMFVFSREITVKNFTTPFNCLDRKFASLSHRNSTAFDSTSGTEQLHYSNTRDTLCADIAV
jgi:hypothetical protein